MSTQSITNAAWADLESMLHFTSKPLPYFLTAILFFLVVYSLQGSKSNVPLLNPRKAFEFTDNRLKKEFDFSAHDMMRNWFAKNPDKPIRLNSDTGKVTVLAPKFANEVRNNERLDIFRFLGRAYHVHLPGFDGFREVCQDSRLVNQVIENDLTKYVGKVTEPVSAETDAAVAELFNNRKDWDTIELNETILRLIARITSRVFLGEKLCRDEAWLEVSREYAVTVFTAAYKLRLWPFAIRSVVHWFLPECRKARAQVRQARNVIEPVLQERRAQKAALQAEGKSVTEFNDAIEWFERASKGMSYDAVAGQLALAFSSIYTTTDLVCQTLTNIAQHPEILEPLREEICTVIGEGGWKKASLYNMKLLDSVMKETQRLKPIESALMRCIALEEVKLSDGTILPKGEVVAVSSHRMWDPSVYDKADQFDGYRFYRMREDTGKENAAQLANTSTDQYGFGLGRRSCPGRFFAANEAKIALIHILLKYDWKLSAGQTPQEVYRAFGIRCDPRTTIEVRRRTEEIQL